MDSNGKKFVSAASFSRPFSLFSYVGSCQFSSLYSMIHKALSRFALHQYFTLYYFQLLVDRYRVHYDRNRFRRTYQYLHERCCLFQFRQLYPDQCLAPPTEYPLYVSKKVFSVQFPRAFFGSMIFRCMAVICFKRVSDTRLKRIWTGTEMFVSAGKFNEITYVLWSVVVYGFLHFTLTECLLDYKFLALLRMSDNQKSNYLKPSVFGLTPKSYKSFDRYRGYTRHFYNSIMTTLLIGGTLVPLFAVSKGGYYTTNAFITFITSFWLVYSFLWILYVCNGIYSNLATFMVISKYLEIKQKIIAGELVKCLKKVRLNQFNMAFRELKNNCISLIKSKTYNTMLRNRFTEHNVRYTHLQDELQDYNRFWSSFLSFLFLNYILLIAVIIYVILFSGTPLYFKYIYSMVLFFHIVLLSAIILHSGALVVSNIKLCVIFKCTLPHFLPGLLDTHQLIKLNHMGQYLTDTQSGFNLLNHYLITYDTFRVVMPIYPLPNSPQFEELFLSVN